MASRFVHLFSVTRHFPDPKKVDLYKSQLQEWIRGNVTGCHQNLFIFDEIDKMPEGLIDSLKPFMDYYKSLDKIDYRRSIFLFLSNTGGKAITHKTYQLWKAGRKRTDFKYSDFEELISGGAFNDEGGFHHSGLITSSLIDYYIPFLPLEKLHVQKCAEVEALKRGRVLTGQMMARVIGSVRFWPEGESLYSENGCKQIYARVVEVLR
ncbi:torsin-1B-like [Tigriopus californicus]|uniref:torsin-1B-like n=1 Tax=Tigriopus californicus TaxID=6832 RepID=UPI0027DA2B25|nr:torsin-1B-like [Tigriopus californicus]